MSTETFLWNLQQGEILSAEKTIEEEQEAIAEDKLKRQRNSANLRFDEE